MKAKRPTNGSVAILKPEQQKARLQIRLTLSSSSRFQDYPVRIYINRRRQERTYCIQYRLYAFVFEGRTTHHRESSSCQHRFTNRITHFFTEMMNQDLRRISPSRFVVFRNCFEQFLTPLSYRIDQIFRDINNSKVIPISSSFQTIACIRDQVNYAFKAFFRTDGYLQRNSIGAQLFF
jgi:hypothetical protein